VSGTEEAPKVNKLGLHCNRALTVLRFSTLAGASFGSDPGSNSSLQVADLKGDGEELQDLIVQVSGTRCLRRRCNYLFDARL